MVLWGIVAMWQSSSCFPWHPSDEVFGHQLHRRIQINLDHTPMLGTHSPRSAVLSHIGAPFNVLTERH